VLRQKAFATLQNMDSVLSNGEQIRKIASRIPDSLAIAQSLLVTVQGNVDYSSSKQLEKHLPSAIAFFKKRKMALEMSRLNANYGSLLIYKGEFKKAQEHLLISYKLFGQLKKPMDKAKVSDLIGTNYGYMGSPTESLKYYQEALSIANVIKDSLLLSNIHSNLGVYYRKVNPDIAIENYYKALSYIPISTKNLMRIKTSYNLANVYYDKGDYASAEAVYQKMLLNCKKQHFIEGTAMAYNGLASVYSQTNRQDKAIPYMLNAVKVADSLGMTNLSLMLKPELISIYKKSGDYKKALDQSEKMKSLSDSLLLKEKQVAVHELDIKYKTKEKDLENKHLLLSLSFRKNTIFILIVLVLVSIGLVLIYRQRSVLLNERNKAYVVLIKKYNEERELKTEEEPNKVNKIIELKPKNETPDLFDKLVMYYEKEKPFLNAKLKMKYVAKLLNVPRKVLTTTIKANGYIGFANFNNKFRVEEVKNCFEDPNYSSLKMEAIALQSGFGSRQSFYTAFEEFTGVNPGFYRAEILKQ
jgi:tetratricopeptide (TPR) repeat protein